MAALKAVTTPRSGEALRARAVWLLVLLAVAALPLPSAPARADSAALATLNAADPATLIATIKANADISGDVVLGLKARDRLAALGRQDPAAVVPLIVAELAPPRAATRSAQQQRIALMGVLRDMGPAAEAAVDVLTEIAGDPKERNDWVVFQARAALAAIGTPEAEAANRAGAEALAESSAAAASETEAGRMAAENAYLIRQELRGRRPAEGVIEAAVTNLRALGPDAAEAVPTLVAAYNDPRLAPALHDALATALRAAGVADVAAAAAEAKARAGEPDLIGAVIADTRSPYDLVNSLAIGELARLGPSRRSVEALVEALAAGRSPGAAAAALGDFGPAAAAALPALLPYFDDAAAGPNAIQAAGKIGQADPAAVVALRRIVSDAQSPTRGLAAKTLADLGAAEAIPDLIGVLGDPRKYERILAANALGAFGAEAEAAVGPLTGLLQAPDGDLRRAATEALGRIGPPAAAAVPQIARQLERGDARLADSAVRALERIGGPEAEAALAAEAKRHAAADLAEYKRLRETGTANDVRRLLRDLPQARRLQLAAVAAAERDPALAVLGIRSYLAAGRDDDAAAALADLVARDDRGLNVLAALGPLLSEVGRPEAQGGLQRDVVTRLKANFDAYPPESQARVRRALEALGIAPE